MKLKLSVILTGILLFILSGNIFAQVTDLNTNLPINKKIIKGTLENGLTYYILKNDIPKNRAELTIAVGVGAVYEDDDQKGLAHFCEHMAFNGTKNFPKNELVNYLQSIGMKFGAEVNAYTGFDQTVYGITVPLDSMKILDKGLQVLYDWGQNVSFDGEEVDKERGIIHEEWRMGQGAQDRMLQKMLPAIFYKSKYAERLPIGTMEIIDKCPHSALTRFYKDWYRPDLMAIIAVGDFDEKVMEKKIKDLFSKMPKNTNPRKKDIFEIPDHLEPIISIITDKEAPATTAQVYYKHPVFKAKTIKDYKKSIAHNLFNSMINKRLAELTLQADQPFVQGFSMYSKFLGPRDVYMSIAVSKNEKLEQGLEAVLTENERVKKFGFTATELEREKKSVIKQVEKQYNERDKRKSNDLLQEIVENFLTNEPIPGIEYEYDLYKQYLQGITLDEVNQLAKDWVTEKNQVVIINAPDKEGVVVPDETKIKAILAKVKTKEITAYVDKVSNKPLISKEPVAGTVTKRTENKKLGTMEWTLSNGAKVVFKNTDFKKDEILFTAYSMGGYSNNKPEDDISAKLACDVIVESGLGEFDKTELEKYLSDKVANVTPWIEEEQEGMEGSSTPKDFETLLQLTYSYFTQPRIDEGAFKSLISKQKAQYENLSTNPESVFRDSITSVMTQYHFRKRPMSVKILDEAKLKRIDYVYKQRFGDPNNFTFLFVGNIDLKVIEPLICKYIGGLPQITKNETCKDMGVTAPKGIVDKTVLKGKEPKSMVFMGFNGDFQYSQQNKLEIDALCTILQIKLLESIREDKSGVYSIGIYPQTEQFPKPTYNIIVFFPCSPDNIEKLSDGVYAEMEKIRKDGPSDVDLNKAKEQKLKERETNLKENNYWLRNIKSVYFNNDKPEIFVDYEKSIKALTKEQIKVAANKYLNKNNFVRVSLKPEQ